MKKVHKSFEFTILKESELTAEIKELLNQANGMLAKSYSPYSEFKVAAALSTKDGQTFVGCNQENASYPLCICAERVALYNAGSSDPNHIIQSIVIIAKNPAKPVMAPVSPCGACRQVILEFEERQKQPIQIYLKGETDELYKLDKASDLLPLHFSSEYL